MKILGISGSLQESSFKTALLRTAQQLAPAGMEIVIADLTRIPPYNEDVYAKGFPGSVRTFRGQIAAADGLLIATPEYNYSYSGVLKSAIDWASRPPEQPFDDKAVAVMGASAGRLDTARAQYHLRQVFIFLNGHVVNKPEVMVGGTGQAFDENGALRDDGTRDLIGQLLLSLQDLSGRIHLKAGAPDKKRGGRCQVQGKERRTQAARFLRRRAKQRPNRPRPKRVKVVGAGVGTGGRLDQRLDAKHGYARRHGVLDGHAVGGCQKYLIASGRNPRRHLTATRTRRQIQRRCRLYARSGRRARSIPELL